MKKLKYRQITDVGNIVENENGQFIFGVETKTSGRLVGPFETLVEAELEHEACLEAVSRKT